MASGGTVELNMTILGIDPGQSGGIAILWNDRDATTLKMPETERDVWEAVRFDFGSKAFAFIEKVHSMPGQGVASTFKFGVGYGGLRMALIAAGIPFVEVTPQGWQKALGIPARKKTETKAQFKNRLKSHAQQLFPDQQVTLATADALLIAEYGRRTRMAAA